MKATVLTDERAQQPAVRIDQPDEDAGEDSGPRPWDASRFENLVHNVLTRSFRVVTSSAAIPLRARTMMSWP